MFKKAAIFSLFLFSLIFVSPVVAGGGPIFVSIGSTIAGWNDSEIRQMVAKVHLHQSVPCVGTKITFKYEDQKDGDYSATTGDGGNTYTIKEVGARWLNGKSVYDCGTYAKYVSKNRESKIAIIEALTPDGHTYDRKVVLSFQLNEPIQSNDDSLPWDNQQDSNQNHWKIDLWLLNQKFIEPNYREVMIKWSALGSATNYNIYSRRSAKSNEWEQQLLGQGGPSAILKLNADEDYYIKVENCKNKIGKCIDSNELFLSKFINQEGKMISQSPNPEISQAPNEDNTKVDELNKKVDNLQNQLAETQQKQSSLEKNFAVILSWIKSIFPFFK